MIPLENELDGIFAVSLEQAVAAPYAGLLLADAGARVVKVERPEGDFARNYDSGAEGESAIFAWLNRGKESLALNLKQSDDLALLKRMLARADVFLSNLAPGAVARLGLSVNAIRAENPGLIACAITGYGESDAAAGKKAYDFLVQAESGLCSVTGSPDAPARVGVSISDLSTGLTAFSAILRALIQRSRTGRGADISISMFDVLADWMNMPLMAERYMGGAPARSGLQHSFVAPYGAFACRDGRQVLLSIQNNREWAAFCAQVLERPELARDPRFADNPERYRNRAALDQIVNDTLGALTLGQAIARLDAAQIANAALNSVCDLSCHPFLRESAARIGGAEISIAALPVRSPGGVAAEVPAVGQHNTLIQQEFSAPDQPRQDPSEMPKP